MAQNRPFRFRLPWLLQPALASPPATAPEPPRTAVQTSVASTSAPKPPFRPPRRAPPPAIVTPRAPPQSASSPVSVTSPPPPPPPPPVEAIKSSVPKSPISKTLDPVATQSTKETQTTTGATSTVETLGPATPPQKTPSFRPLSPPPPSSPAKSESQPSSPAKSDSRPSSPAKSDSRPSSPAKLDSRPSSPAKSDSRPSSPAKLDSRPSSPAKSDSRPSSPAKSDSRPSSPAKFDSRHSSPAKSDSQPSSPSRTGTQFRDSSPPVSPSRMPTPPRANSKPLSPSRLATQPGVPTNLSSPSNEATQSIATQPTSPVHVQPPPPSPPAPTTTTTTTPVQEALVNHVAQPSENKRSNETTHEKFPVDSYRVPLGADLGINPKPKEINEGKAPQTKSMNLHSMESKSPKLKPKPTTAHVPLHSEIKEDISKFIHRLATNPPKQSMDEKPASVITLAGDNKGAIMHLGSDANKREGYKLDAIINGEGSSNSKEPQKDSRSSEDQETKAIVNSNIQGINNSIMFNSSVTERNPGVHLAFSRTLAKTDSNIESAEPMEMYKAEADITPPETRVYDPTMGRSIGGFFLEPSDCEPDDLEVFAEEYQIEVL